ncbi:MAG: peptidoglycan-binding domain-containing protein, partial [Chloroflexota bacterium]
LPSFLGASSVIPVQLAKRALASLDMYKGPINDEDDEAFRKAVMEFQKSRNLAADGMLGAVTLRALQDAAPKFFPGRP